MKKKGFTLIELLTVIVILGILALITTPVITNIINNARKNTFKNSAYGIVQAANQYYLNSKLTGVSFDEITFTVNNNKLMSENKELSFTGKSPIGSSYVKINSDGEIAINITDGTYFATKEYDETGVLITGEEEKAVTREELANKMAQLETTFNETLEELNKKNEEMDELKTNITNNTISLNNLTNKNNSENIYMKLYPVGSKYITKTNENPASYLGGTWTLRDKNLKNFTKHITEGTEYFIPTSNVSEYTIAISVTEHSYFIRLIFVSAVEFADTTLEIGTINFPALGFTKIQYDTPEVASTDGGNGYAKVLLENATGLVTSLDIVSKSAATSIAAGAKYDVVFSGIFTNYTLLLDEFCDEFIWERTA